MEEQLIKEKAELDARIFVLRSGINESLLYLERARLRRVSLWWIILCFFTMVCTVDAILKLKVAHAFFCFVAFLFNWRGLYIEQNATPSLMALGIVTISILTL
jgi:hypothetical protein